MEFTGKGCLGNEMHFSALYKTTFGHIDLICNQFNS